MAQPKPEYSELNEFGTIATKLVAKYPEVFAQLDLTKVKCMAITNKERPEKKPSWEVKGVPFPVRLDCPYSYYVVVYTSEWIELDEAHQAALVFDALCSIPVDEENEGKKNPSDVKGYGVVLRTLGVDFMERADLPNILTTDIKWQIR